MLSTPEEIRDPVVLALVFGRTTVGTHETRFSSINISDHQKYGRRLKIEILTTLPTTTLWSAPIRDKDDEFSPVAGCQLADSPAE